MKKLFSVGFLLLAVQTFAWEPQIAELKVVNKNFCSAIATFYDYDEASTCTGKLFFIDPNQEVFLPKGAKYRIMSSAVQFGVSETVYDCAAWVREDLSVDISDCDIQF